MKDNHILTEVGHNIRALRLEKGWTQERLAEESRLDRSFLGKLERGRVNVSIYTLCDISKALGIEIIKLFAHGSES